MNVLVGNDRTLLLIIGSGQGVRGADGVMSEAEVVTIINSTLTANQTSGDGINITNGRIHLAIGELQSLP